MVSAQTIVNQAASYIGIEEIPQNEVIFNTRYYGTVVNGIQYSWCVVFIWCLFDDFNANDQFVGGIQTASSDFVYSWANQNNSFYTTPQVGDIIIYDWQAASGEFNPDHVGIVESIDNGKLIAIEGNTSNPVSGRPDGVFRKDRTNIQYLILGYYRPKYGIDYTKKSRLGVTWVGRNAQIAYRRRNG